LVAFWLPRANAPDRKPAAPLAGGHTAVNYDAETSAQYSITSLADRSQRLPFTQNRVHGSTSMKSPKLSIDPRRQRGLVAISPMRFAARRARASNASSEIIGPLLQLFN
jgi:hypothetical protein